MRSIGQSLLKTCLIAALLIFCAGCKETILHNLNEGDANRIISELHKKSLQSEKIKQADGLWSVAVEKELSHEALSVLNTSRIIKEQPKLKNNSSSIMSSREEQLFQFERALSQEIEFTLASLPGVLETRVHLNLPVRDPLFAQQISSNGTASASVMVIANEIFRSKKTELQELVAGAAGIKKNQISILINKIAGGESSAIKTAAAAINLTVENIEAENSKNSSLLLSKNLYSQIAISLLIIFVFYCLYSLKRKNKKLLDLKEIYLQK